MIKVPLVERINRDVLRFRDRRRFFGTGFFVSSIIVLCFGCRVSAIENLSKGQKLYAQGDYVKARAYFESRIVANPNNATEHYCLANTLLKLQKYEEAMNEYRKAQTLSPKGPIGDYCRSALATLSRPAPQAAPPEIQPSQIGGRRAAFNSGHVDQQRAAIVAEGEAAVAKIKEEEDRQVAALNRDAKESQVDASEYVHAKGVRRGAEAYNADVRSEVDNQIKSIKSNAERRIEETKKFYQQKADAYN